MKLWAGAIALTLVATCALGRGWDPNEKEASQQQAQSRAQASDEAILAFKATDPSLQVFFDRAAGYAVFPSVGKGGFGLGGARGKGKVYQGGAVVGDTTMTQFTIGFQAGGQRFRQIIFFRDQAALDLFKSGKFAMSAQATAIAAAANAGATAAYNDGVAIFTMGITGLMFEASVGGQKFSFVPHLGAEAATAQSE